MSLSPRLIPAAGLAALLAGCAVGPAYQRPTTPEPVAYKALDGWKAASPADHLARGDWWSLLGDPQLDALASRVKVSNQTVAAAEAAYRQARALVREQRASLFPTIDLSGSATKSGGDTTSTTRRYQAAIGASWEPDVWGRLRKGVENASASAQASAADLAAAQLSAQGELVVNYLGLRQTDIEIALIGATVEGYQRAQAITQNRYAAGIAPKSDVLQAQSQLASAQSDLVGLEKTRATYENAIAVLVGEAPSTFRIAAKADWTAAQPVVPVGVPSTLLERRPDIAAAERKVAAANAEIGVARAALFPTFTLSGSSTDGAARLGDLFSTSANTWSLGLSAAQTLFDAGARRAQVAQARAAYDSAVADYRQTVLTGFQDVENQLTAIRVLERQDALQQTAATAADQTEQMLLNQYKAGQIAYTDVVTAQASALSARRTLTETRIARQTAAMALIQALGGDWEAGEANKRSIGIQASR